MPVRIALLAFVAFPVAASAQDTLSFPEESQDAESSGDLLRPAQMGNLQRVVASLESTLDVYRLALGEVAIAIELIVDLGAEPGTGPDRAVPESAREVFDRLARVLASRVPAAALAPIPRGYHFEALDALENLASARVFANVRQPLKNLARSIRRLSGVADEVVDLFSRQRPIQVQIFDADTALEQISDALEAVSLAERRILSLRKTKAGLNEQFQAFLFLEISLGNALDLIAAAEEAGINVGFELQIELERFKSILGRVRDRAEQLEGQLERIETRPKAGVTESIAWILDSKLSVAFVRTPEARASAYRVETAIDEAMAEARNDALTLCGIEPLEVIDTEYKLLSHLPADADGLEVPLLAAPGAPVRVRITPVNAFGVEGESKEVLAEWVSPQVVAPDWVSAEVADVSPEDPEFYRDFDQVVIEWPTIHSDPSPEVRKRIPDLDFAARLEVFRGEEKVATLPPGARRFVDRPSAEWLQAGAVYSVRVVTAAGNQAQSVACGELSTAQRETRYELQLASAGARYFSRPSGLERDVITRLRGDLAKRDELWSKVKDRSDLLERWWAQLPADKRSRWLNDWVELHGGRESLWCNRAPRLVERDRDWVLASIWLETQDRDVRREVDRIWKLVHPKRRSEIERRWFESRDVEWRQELAKQLSGADEAVRAGLLAPARVQYWVSTKDAAEFETVERWWRELGSEAQDDLVSEWLSRQPAGLRKELRWPSADALTDQERKQRMDNAYRELPVALHPEFLAWWRFEQLAGDERITAVAADVGALRAGWERLRYRARFFDVATGFNGALIYGLGVVLLPLVAVWLLRRRRTG